MSLNVQEIKGFRTADKSYKKYDSRGLLLLVKPNGSKLWYFKYRFGGKEKKLPIGAFPEVSLSQARQLRDRARLKVSDGIDPMLERKRKKARIKLGAENTFEVIANKYIDEKMVPEGRAEATLRKARWFLQLLKPAIGNMPNQRCRSATNAGGAQEARSQRQSRNREEVPILRKPGVPVWSRAWPVPNRSNIDPAGRTGHAKSTALRGDP